MNKLSDFAIGFGFILRGWTVLFASRRLIVYALLPVLISISMCVTMLWILWGHIGLWTETLVNLVVGVSSGWMYDLVYYPLLIGGGVVVFVAAVYATFVLHTLICIPFYSLLAERALGEVGFVRSRLGVKGALRLFRAGLFKSFVFAGLGICLFVLSFIPLLNLIAFAVAMLILSFDTMDYGFEAAGLDLRRRFAFLLGRPALWTGMAAAMALTFLVPGLTLLVAPGAVTGAALLLASASASFANEKPNEKP